MRKVMKRIATLITAVMMMLTMCIPVMAADTADTTTALTGIPSAADRGTMTITGLKKGDTVTWYPIAKAQYDGGGFTGYKTVVDGSPKDITAPTADEMTSLAKNATILAQTDTLTATAAADGPVTVSAPVGEYVAVVTSVDPSRIYNPILSSVYYSTDGQSIIGGTVKAGDKYIINGTSSYAKSTDETSGKKVNPGKSATSTRDNGDDVAIGDKLHFELTGLIPSYSKQYTTVTYKINDEMDGSLDLDAGSIKVLVGGKEVAADGTVYSVTTHEHSFELYFQQSYILGLAGNDDAGRAVTVTYDAKLNANATLNFDANNNKATFTYTNKPDSSTTTEEHKTYQYTFAIDGNINGSQKQINRKGHELIKVNEKGEPVNEPKWIDDGTDETTIENGLAGAEFTLTNDTTKKVYTATTDTNGYFNGFTGLDAGTYTLVETKAPAGYSLNTTKHTVVIAASYNDDGTLKDYSITIDGKNTSHYTATYESGAVKTITTIGKTVTTYIKNTKLNSLPSTGGMGTYLFTGIGAVIIAAALGLFFHGKKSSGSASE
ncbi:MAG: isopeptide-forming domain-containing fimbrial protein [Eubacterium sp.]|nr:isopeptide-forming domain-containing fimbrial protein [Eubacterium sp.]